MKPIDGHAMIKRIEELYRKGAVDLSYFDIVREAVQMEPAIDGELTKQERIRKYGEVFTPQDVVAHMCDMLEDESPGAFAPDKTFLEPTCGDGAFVVEILRRKFDNCRTRSDFTAAINSVYGLEIQADNVAECIRRVTTLCNQYFKPTKAELQIINDHYIMCDSLKVMRMMADENLQSR